MRHAIYLLVFAGCIRPQVKLSSPTAPKGASITFTPTQGFAATPGFVATVVKISGSELGGAGVTFSGSLTPVTSACTGDDTDLESRGLLLCVPVPQDATSGPITAANESKSVTSTQSFQLTGEPSVDAIAPVRGFGALVTKPGNTPSRCVLADVDDGTCLRVFTLSGRNFDGQNLANNRLTVDGTEATVIAELSSAASLTFDAGSRTSVKTVRVETPAGSDEVSLELDVPADAPTLEGFAPLKTMPLTAVLIRGTGFDDENIGNNEVVLEVDVNGTKFIKTATVTAATAQTLSFVVPSFASSEMPAGTRGRATLVARTPRGSASLGTLEVFGPPLITNVYADNRRVNELITERSRFIASVGPVTLTSSSLAERGAKKSTEDIVEPYGGNACEDSLPPLEKVASRLIVCGTNFDLINSRLTLGGLGAELTGLLAGRSDNECQSSEQALVFAFPSGACPSSDTCQAELVTLAGSAQFTSEVRVSPAATVAYALPSVAQPDQVVRVRGQNFVDHPKAQAVVVGEGASERCARLLWVSNGTDFGFRLPADAKAGEKVYLRKGAQRIDLGITIHTGTGHLKSDSYNVSTLIGDSNDPIPTPYQFRKRFSGGSAVNAAMTVAYTLQSRASSNCNGAASFDLYEVNLTSATSQLVKSDLCDARRLELSPAGDMLAMANVYSGDGRTLYIELVNTTTFASTKHTLATAGVEDAYALQGLEPASATRWAVAYAGSGSQSITVLDTTATSTPVATAVTGHHEPTRFVWENASTLWEVGEDGRDQQPIYSYTVGVSAGGTTLTNASGPDYPDSNGLFAFNGATVIAGSREADKLRSDDDKLAIGSTSGVLADLALAPDVGPSGENGVSSSFSVSVAGGDVRIAEALFSLEKRSIARPPPPIGDPLPPLVLYLPRLPIRGTVKAFHIPLTWDGVSGSTGKSMAGVVVARGRVAMSDEVSGLRDVDGRHSAMHRPKESSDGSKIAQHTGAAFERTESTGGNWSEQATSDVWITDRRVTSAALDESVYGVAQAITYAQDGTLYIVSKAPSAPPEPMQLTRRSRGATSAAVVNSAAAFDTAIKSGAVGVTGSDLVVDAMMLHPGDKRLYLLYSGTDQSKVYARSLDITTFGTEPTALEVYNDSSATNQRRTLQVLQGSDDVYVPGFKRDPADNMVLSALRRTGNVLSLQQRTNKDSTVMTFVENAAVPAIAAYGVPKDVPKRYQIIDNAPRSLEREDSKAGTPIARYLPPDRGFVPAFAPIEGLQMAHGRAILEAPLATDLAKGQDQWQLFGVDFAVERPNLTFFDINSPIPPTSIPDPDVWQASDPGVCRHPQFTDGAQNYVLGCLTDPHSDGHHMDLSKSIVASPSGRRAYTFIDDQAVNPWQETSGERYCLHVINADQGSIALSRLYFCIQGQGPKPSQLAISPYGDELAVIDGNGKVWVVK